MTSVVNPLQFATKQGRVPPTARHSDEPVERVCHDETASTSGHVELAESVLVAYLEPSLALLWKLVCVVTSNVHEAFFVLRSVYAAMS